ncbi:hypothetical protein ACF0H5_013812 [Mactra antiquata]
MFKEIPFSTNLLGYASLGAMVTAVICTCLAIGLPYWEYNDVSLASQQNLTNHGLWIYCIKYQPESTSLLDTCGDPLDIATSDGKTDIQAARALVIIALILELAAGVSTVMILFVWKRKYFIHYVAAGLAIAAGFFSMFTLAVYNARIRKDDYDLHVCTTLDIIAWLVAWTSAGFIIYMALVKKQDES